MKSMEIFEKKKNIIQNRILATYCPFLFIADLKATWCAPCSPNSGFSGFCGFFWDFTDLYQFFCEEWLEFEKNVPRKRAMKDSRCVHRDYLLLTYFVVFILWLKVSIFVYLWRKVSFDCSFSHQSYRTCHFISGELIKKRFLHCQLIDKTFLVCSNQWWNGKRKIQLHFYNHIITKIHSQEKAQQVSQALKKIFPETLNFQCYQRNWQY